MTKTQFRLGVLAIFAAILLHNLTSPHRYSMQGDSVSMVKMDRITGKTWRYRLDRTTDGVHSWIVIPVSRYVP